jgi:DNA-binding GntR family transcriptional regulator
MIIMDERIYSEIKRRIVLLDYEPGQALREKELTEEFGVSRTPVREALIRLEAERLVRIIPNSGIYVTEVRFQDLKDVFEIRSFLIGLVGRLAAERVTDQELDEMKALLGKIKGERDSRILRELDLCFHDLINGATQNKILVDTLERLRNQAGRIWIFTSDDDEYLLRIGSEFEELIKALEDRDGDKCEEILRGHVMHFIEHISQFVGSSVGRVWG